MAINPLLLNVKPISEITTVDNPIEGHLLFYDGSDELKKVDISEFQSLIGGIAKPLAITDASPTVSGWYKPTTSGTYANAGGLVAQVGYDTLFYFDGTTWSKAEVDIPVDQNLDKIADLDKKIDLSSYNSDITFNELPTSILFAPFQNNEDGLEALGIEINMPLLKATYNRHEVGIYDENFTKIVSSTATDLPKEGFQFFGLPYSKLKQGKYYIGYSFFRKDDPTYLNLKMIKGKGYKSTHIFPLPSSVSAVEEIPYIFEYRIVKHNDLRYTGFESYRNPDIRHMLAVPSWGIIGYNTTTFKTVKSVDNGNTWTEMGGIPNAGCYAIRKIGNYLYWAMSNATIYKSSDITVAGTITWTDIAPSAKHPNAVILPSGLDDFKGYLFYGEYSQTSTGELKPDGGPKIHRYNPTTGVWTVSKQFPNARHVHSFTAQGTASLYVCLGDAGWGSEVGYHRITSVAADGVEDSWVQWTYTHDAVDGNSHYPVSSTIGTIDGVLHLIGGADRTKMFINTVKLGNTSVGQALINARVYNMKDSDSTETMRGGILDARGNFYAVTAESTKKRLLVSPPPYIDRYVLADNLNYDLTLPMSINGEYIFMERYRFKTVTFESQASISSNVVTKNSSIIFDSKNKVDLTKGSVIGSGEGKTITGTDLIYFYAKNTAVGTNHFQSLMTTNQIDFTNISSVKILINIKKYLGTNPALRTKVSTDTSITGALNGKELITTINSLGTKLIHFDVINQSGNKYLFLQALASQVSEVEFDIVSVWLE